MDAYLREKKKEYMVERTEPYTLEDLKVILKILRSDEGCPWDRRQTFESMIPCVEEEAGEVVQAVRNQDAENLCEELGDLLFQVMFYSQMAEEKGLFTFEQVADQISAKMVRRHPGIFGKNPLKMEGKEADLWEQVKRAEKAKKAQKTLTKQV